MKVARNNITLQAGRTLKRELLETGDYSLFARVCVGSIERPVRRAAMQTRSKHMNSTELRKEGRGFTFYFRFLQMLVLFRPHLVLL